MIRHRFAVGDDKLKEFMPSIEQDGVSFSNPGWKYPLGDPDSTRGISVDQVNPVTGAMWNVSNPMGAVSNDDFIAWGHDMTPSMHNQLNKLADAVGTPPNYQLAGIKAGEGLIDLYPCFGFLKGADSFRGAFKTSSSLAPKSEGVPIKGRYGNDNAYRDFDSLRGIFSIFEYYDWNYQEQTDEVGQQVSPGPCFFTPYAAACPAYPAPRGGFEAAQCWDKAGPNAFPLPHNNQLDCEKAKGHWYSKGGDFVTYRYKLSSVSYDQRRRIYVPDTTDPTGKSVILVDNPNFGGLLDFTFVQPATADIPIDLSHLGYGRSYTGGPVSDEQGDFSHYYYATVTELRAALSGFESWSEYTQIFAPWLHCTLGLPTCAMGIDNPGDGGSGANMAGGWDNQAQLHINRAPGLFPYPLVHAFNRWLGVVPPLFGDEDHDGRYDKQKSLAGEHIPASAQEQANKILQAVFERVSETASCYGKKYLMALPFTPPDTSQHIRQLSEVSFDYEQKWDISNDGWVDIDVNTPEMGKRYPHNINFYSGEGNLEPFVVFPQFRKETISKRQSRVFPGTNDPKSLHFTPLQDSLGGGSLGKMFKKAGVNKTTYWLWNASTYDIQTGRAKTGTIKPYALIEQNERAYLQQDDLLPYDPTAKPGIRWHQNRRWTYHPYSVPLSKLNGRFLFNSNFVYGLATGIYHQGSTQAGAAQDAGKFTIAPAAYAPWAAAVPQKSNRYKWGPWALGTGFGKVKYEVASDFHPAAFGGFDNMEVAGIERCKAAVEPDNKISGWSKETGTITLAGLPSSEDGDGRSIMGRQLMGQGPYITDVSLDIGPNGVTTTYNMQTQRKFGKLAEIYENRMRQQASDIVSTLKDIEELRRY